MSWSVSWSMSWSMSCGGVHLVGGRSRRCLPVAERGRRVAPTPMMTRQYGLASVDVESLEGGDRCCGEGEAEGEECGELADADAGAELVVADGPEERGEPSDAVQAGDDGGEGAEEI